jgi:hypothetical protein
MVGIQRIFGVEGAGTSPPDPNKYDLLTLILMCAALALVFMFMGQSAFAAPVHIPGEDASDKLEAAGTLLRLVDTGLFKWGARIFAGICIMSAGWALKEQRFGIAIICVIGAIIFGTAPTWVKNIFEIGGNQGVFSQTGTEKQTFVALASANSGGESHA